MPKQISVEATAIVVLGPRQIGNPTINTDYFIRLY